MADLFGRLSALTGGPEPQQAPSPLALLGSGGAGGGPFGDWAAPLPRGGVFGSQKWLPGNGIDIFMPRGTPVYAMFDGTVAPYGVPGPGPGGQVGGFLLNGDNGYTMQGIHAQLTAQGRVRKGQVIGYVNDPSMDMLGAYPGMPDGFQHLDLTIGRGRGPFPLQGGDVNAAQWLQQSGYGSPSVGQTRGPNGGPMGGMGMPGMGGPMGMGGLPGLPGMGGPGGMFGGGMPGMMGGLPGLGGPGGFPGMGMPPMIGAAGGIFGGMGGGGPFGGLGMPPLPMLPPMLGGGFGGGGLGPIGGPGVGGGIYGGGNLGAAGPVMAGPGVDFGRMLNFFQNPMMPGGAGFGQMGFGPLASGLGGFGGGRF